MWRRRTAARSEVTQHELYAFITTGLTVMVVASLTSIQISWSRGMFRSESITLDEDLPVNFRSGYPQLGDHRTKSRGDMRDTHATLVKHFGTEQDYELAFCFFSHILMFPSPNALGCQCCRSAQCERCKHRQSDAMPRLMDASIRESTWRNPASPLQSSSRAGGTAEALIITLHSV